MTEITHRYRAFLAGMAAGLIGVTVFAAAKASADPVVPAPPAPAVPAPAPQSVVTVPQKMAAVTPPSANVPAPAALGSSAAAPTLVPAASGTLRDYFQSKGVKLEAQKPQGFNAFDITLPMPPRWTLVPDPNVPDAFAVTADRHGNSIYTSNAQLVVYKLVGNFDPKEAITHGYLDSQKLPGWQTTNASMADFQGFPSSIIEGTYRDGDMMLNTSRRHVIATSGRDKYLVTLSVSTDRLQAVADAPATDAIVGGFRVTVPGTTPAPAPAPAPVTAPVGLPAQTPSTSPVGLPSQAAGAAPLALPGRVPGQPAQLSAPRPQASLADLLPGLPPLPNFSFLQHG